MDTTNGIKTTPGFCPNCGSILPLLSHMGDIQCYTCRKSYPAEGTLAAPLLVHNFFNMYFFCTVFGTSKIEYTINFNTINIRKPEQSHEDEEDGPIVERRCPKCGNERMSYATLQLRSADEGQTVFFTCTKCK